MTDPEVDILIGHIRDGVESHDYDGNTEIVICLSPGTMLEIESRTSTYQTGALSYQNIRTWLFGKPVHLFFEIPLGEFVISSRRRAMFPPSLASPAWPSLWISTTPVYTVAYDGQTLTVKTTLTLGTG